MSVSDRLRRTKIQMERDENATLEDILKEMEDFKRYATSRNDECRYVAFWLYDTFPKKIRKVLHRMNIDIGK